MSEGRTRDGAGDVARFKRVREALVALEGLAGEARAAELERLRVEEPTIYDEVVTLAGHAEAPAGILGENAIAARLGLGERQGLPRMLGVYRLVERIGEGGMGVVFRAEQTAPITREVAVKIIARGVGSAHVVARFELERQVLARLEHPNIARVLDAGEDEHGSPYFVMELVRGDSLTAWCESRRSPLGERIELLLAVCDAIEHAHRRGIIHRDLKPSNVLVAERDGVVVPKVIDFGIAKAIGEARDEDARGETLTLDGQVIGTPEYMSPEQAGAFGGAVDTRTDVYALGVMLYELLTGERPYRIAQRDGAALHGVLSHTAPARPSSRVAEREKKRLVGDLDVIALRALEPDPERRYGSVAELAADLRRHLAGLPILARPDTLGYRLGKLVRRHRVAFALGVAALVGLIGFVVALLVQADALAEEKDRALAAEAQAAAEARRAVQAAAGADSVADFLVGLFSAADPAEAQGEALTVRELVDRGAARLEAGRGEEMTAGVRGRLLHVLGTVYHSLGMNERAEELLGEALEVRRAAHGAESVEVADTLAELGAVKHDQGDYAGAVAQAREVLAARRAALGPKDASVASSLNDLAISLQALGEVDEAERYYREALALNREVLGDDHLEVAWGMNTLAQALYARADYAGARELLVEALAIQRATLDPAHPDIAATLNNLGGTDRALGELKRSEEILREARAVYQTLYGDSHAGVARAHQNLSGAVRLLGDPVDGAALAMDALTLYQRLLGPEHPYLARALVALGASRRELGDLEGAGMALDEALAIRLARLPPEHREVALSRLELGELYTAQRRWEEARAAIAAATAGLAASDGGEHPSVADALLAWAKLDIARGAHAEALEHGERVVAMRKKALVAGHWQIAEAELAQARALAGVGREAAARALLQRCHAGLLAALGAEHPLTREAARALAEEH